MTFEAFAQLIYKQFEVMKKMGPLFKVGSNKTDIWQTYITAFPIGTNPLYQERTEHDCNCCKNFIRDIGNAVVVVDNKLISVWDVAATDHYAIVAKAMSEYIKSLSIKNVFSNHSQKAGAKQTHQQLADNSIKTWKHFYADVDRNMVNVPGERLSQIESTQGVFKRGLETITDEAIITVQDLISQNSLYRGEEFSKTVTAFATLKKAYDKLTNETEKDIFRWSRYNKPEAKIRNTVIGTLLTDLSENNELDASVSKYESKVAPANYKRPTTLITPGMVKQAMETVNELGIEPSLHRRFAIPEDISVNNVLFANRSTAAVMKDGLSDMLMAEVKTKAKDYSKIEEISITDFTNNVLPNITTMEVLMENKHSANLVSLIAPKNADAPNILKWKNNFTWSYAGNVADSMKEKVKAAGGNIEGVLRFSIQWNDEGNDGSNDLDAHCREPGGNVIYYGSKTNRVTGGNLDVDITDPSSQATKGIAIENITWPKLDKMQDGTYKFWVKNFSGRNTNGFTAEIEFNGQIHSFSYNKSATGNTQVAEVVLKDDKFTIKPVLESSTASKQVWNVNTEQFSKVSILTISPNHWDEQSVGNKHWFFILDSCKTDEAPRGFYNEFLDGKLDKHRKVFEILGVKTKCEMSDEQLSGLGFSSTVRNSLIVKVSGNFNRTLKIKF